jgi:chitinase
VLAFAFLALAFSWNNVFSRNVHSQTSFTEQWSVGYYTPWGNPGCPISEIDMSALTHIVHWVAIVNPDGTLDLNLQQATRDAPALIAAAHAGGVKVMLGLIQTTWLGHTMNFHNAVMTRRGDLVNNVMAVVDAYGYDGVNIDWEPFDMAVSGVAMRFLAADFRARLGTRILTADAVVNHSRYWGTVQELFDRINVMTYDLTGTWNPYSWHNAALYDTDGMVFSVDRAIKQYVANGTPAVKLNIGIPFYGWRWTGGGISGPKQRWSTMPDLRQVYYQTFAATLPQQGYGWDGSAKVPYASSFNTFLTFDNEQSVTEKVNYVRANNLGGWIIWELSGDYMPQQAEKHPLLKAVKTAMTATMAPQ